MRSITHNRHITCSCADPLCPIVCGGKSERARGETGAWLAEVLRRQVSERNETEQAALAAAENAMQRARERGRREDPAFWK